MNRKDYVIDLVATMVSDRITAEIVVDRLIEENLLHLGFGDAEVDAVVEKFKDTFGTTSTSKRDRWAATRLVKIHGLRSVIVMIDLLGKLRQEPYAPVVNSVFELDKKFVSITAFLRKQGNSETIDVI